MSTNTKEQLQNYVDMVRRRYDGMADQERLIVNAVALLVLATLIFLLLIAPAQRSVSDAQMKISGQQKLVQWMKENESLARMAAGSGATVTKSDQPLQTIVTSTAGPLGVTVKRYENESETKLRVWLEKVPFDKTVRWLDQLESRYGVQIISVSIDAEKEPGIITAKLVLQG
ncbi:MAG TPA: type II secretion system protein M [Dongiaceae bacterium]|nr:type II secretion system protein M [Dongiaceae bacterium]